MLHEDRDRAETFGSDAERYDRTRPSYPPALIDELAAGSPRRVLDVGCGTGIAARLLRQRGMAVLGVEPDGRMALVARRHGIEVEEATFETWEPASRTFDLVLSAQAWHWVDPATGPGRAAAVLTPGGRIALCWNVGVLPPAVRAALDGVYRAQDTLIDGYSVLLGHASGARLADAIESLHSGGHFTDVTERSFPHDVSYTTDAWLDLLPTHSDHRMLPPERLDALLADVGAALDRLGGGFTMRYESRLVTARRA